MARYVIQAENQLERIEKLNQMLNELSKLSKQSLVTRPRPKKWSVVEIVQHMVIAQKVYAPKINGVLDTASKSTNNSEHKASFVPSYLIKSFPPQQGKVKSKMKTFKRFLPVINDLNGVDVEQEFKALHECLNELSSWVKEYSMKDTAGIKFNSAIGAVVRFNVPEACEFILGHNERHFHQINEALAMIENK